MRKSFLLLGMLTLILPLMFLGCGDNGSDGSPGAPGISTGTITGTVTNSADNTGLANATVSTSPNQGTTTTAADGTYSLTNVPAGVYEVTFEKDDFGTVTSTVSVLADITSTEDAKLVPTANVLVTPSVDGTEEPGSTLTASVDVLPLDGSTVTGYKWEQTNSVTVTIDNNTAPTTGVTLPGLAAYRDELIKVLAEPPGGGALPEGVPLPPVDEEDYSGGIQDRFGVVAINPLALEEAGAVTLKVTVTTTSGEYSKTVAIETSLPWKFTTGLQNVPINVPVLLQGKNQASYDWSISPSVPLDNNTIQNPSFTPTAAGTYAVTENVSGTTFTVYAGTWVGVITGLDANGRPLASGCNPGCHALAGVPVVNEIFGDWAKTGHAEIFTNNLNAGGHYGESCFVCHTVGYDTNPAAINNGIDDQTNYQAFLDQFFPGGHAPATNPDNFTNMLADYPNVAKLTNIQCENCHGPNNSPAHNNADVEFKPERFSLSSDLCGSCHGEPARHGRYQQWQLSLHADYDLAIRERNSGSCARCHTGNGFLAWGENYDWAGGQSLAPEDITWTEDTVHPQTCATCHDPHNIGTTTGEPTNAQVRIENDTPVLDAGWQAFGVGRGAICMVCHNQRRGLTNDNWSLGVQGAPMPQAREPHHGPQSDILMGQSAFFIPVGIPGAHARVPDTCVGCHMEKTPPPDLLSYNLGGTNHTFYAAPDICGECHTSIENSATVKNNTLGQLELIGNLIGPATGEQITAIINSGDDVIIRFSSTDNVTLTAADFPITGSNYVEGEMTITTLDNTYTGVSLDDLYVNAISDPNRFALASEETQILVKASWNYVIVVDDKSGGVHNPSFVATMLGNTFDMVQNTDFTVRTLLP